MSIFTPKVTSTNRYGLHLLDQSMSITCNTCSEVAVQHSLMTSVYPFQETRTAHCFITSLFKAPVTKLFITVFRTHERFTRFLLPFQFLHSFKELDVSKILWYVFHFPIGYTGLFLASRAGDGIDMTINPTIREIVLLGFVVLQVPHACYIR